MLDRALASAVLKTQNDLVIASRMAHWNVRGNNFYEAHLLFGRIYESASANVDTLVEVLRALGYDPTFNEFSGPGGGLPSYGCQDLIKMLIGMVTTYYAALISLRDSAKEESMAVGLVNLLEDLCQESTVLLYLLSSAQV
jgi:hypothetical protein